MSVQYGYGDHCYEKTEHICPHGCSFSVVDCCRYLDWTIDIFVMLSGAFRRYTHVTTPRICPPFGKSELCSRGIFRPAAGQHRPVEGAIRGMLETLGDRNTIYLPPSEHQASEDRFNGQFQGIGTTTEMIDDRVVIVTPHEGSPAEMAGLRPGDVLVSADGTDPQDSTLRKSGRWCVTGRHCRRTRN